MHAREQVQAAEHAAQAQAHKLKIVLEEQASLDGQLQHSQHQLVAAQAAATAAGQQKGNDLQLLAAQLKVPLHLLLSWLV